MSDYPVGVQVVLDPQTRELSDGSLLGGSPRRLLRLTSAGQRAFLDLRCAPVTTRDQARLARRLTDAGVAHPVVEPARLADVTVLIPVRDRADALDACLHALGGEHRVLVVDDGSQQPHLVAKVCAEHGARYLARSTNGGPAAARNTGLRAIDSEFVLLLDSDCVPPRNLVSALAGHLADPLVVAVAPRVMGDNGYVSPLDLGTRPALVAPGGAVAYVPTAALLVRRAELPAFDEALRFGEDVDVMWRLVEAGHRVRYEPRVVVTHTEPCSLGLSLRRRFHYGTSAGPLAVRHPGAVPPLVIHRWSFLVLLGVLLRRPSLSAVGLVGGYQELGGMPSAAFRCSVVFRSAWLSWVGLSRWCAQYALPLVALTARRRPQLAALLVTAPLVTWWQRRSVAANPVQFTAVELAGDAAYGLGVITGALHSRTLEPLRPVSTRHRRNR